MNGEIWPKSFDLKEGALVISLESFAAGGEREVTERNADDISAILDVSMQEYDTMNVSWESGVAKFYVHRVDRAGYAGSCARFEVARRRSTRSR